MTAIFVRFFVDNFMRISNFWYGSFYMLKSNIDVFFCDVISLLAPVFYSFIE